MPLDPKIRTYPAGKKAPLVIVRCAAALSIVLFGITLAVVRYSWGGEHGVVPLYALIGLWAVGPPIWFWFEYFYVYREHGEPDTLELFKYGQDISKAIWAGVLAVLIAFAASDAAKPKTTAAALACPCPPAGEPAKPPGK